ncbi:hypothetical protein SAMN02745866_03898 [Alteromonadaceae bacterium Bs31]|nr:hypothetical protein SAMN02745866_03898 [Alteromonadaceae bacterium Bs31]
MNNKDALMIANSLLCEIRLLLNQDKTEQAKLVAEIGQTLPIEESSYTRDMITYEKLFDYMQRYPERQELLHFHSLLNIDNNYTEPSLQAVAN